MTSSAETQNDRILIIDPDGGRRLRLLNVLQASDFLVEAVADITAALHLVDEARFDLILAQYHLGPMDALQFIRKLSEAGWKRSVIVMAENAHGEDALRIIKAGAYDVIMDSIQPEQRSRNLSPPDHDPGRPQEWRALQLERRGDELRLVILRQ